MESHEDNSPVNSPLKIKFPFTTSSGRTVKANKKYSKKESDEESESETDTESETESEVCAVCHREKCEK